jgi:hypothetical protein
MLEVEQQIVHLLLNVSVEKIFGWMTKLAETYIDLLLELSDEVILIFLLHLFHLILLGLYIFQASEFVMRVVKNPVLKLITLLIIFDGRN